MFGFYNKRKVMGGVCSSTCTPAPTPRKRVETRESIFAACKGVRTAKKAKNHFSREEAGTAKNMIITKRFPNSRLTCVCRTKIY